MAGQAIQAGQTRQASSRQPSSRQPSSRQKMPSAAWDSASAGDHASPKGAQLKQRLMGNRAGGAVPLQRAVDAHTISRFADHRLNRVERPGNPALNVSQQGSDPFFRAQPKVQVASKATGIQRFKDKTEDKDEVSEAAVNVASLDTLKEWLGREAVESSDWEEVADDNLVPMGEIRELIVKRIKTLEADAAERDRLEKAAKMEAALEKEKQEKLTKLGVTEEEHTAILGFTSDEALITNAAKGCNKKKWSLLEVLNQTRGFSEELKLIVLGMLAKGVVTKQSAIVTLCTNWTNLNNRETIDVDVLISLLKDEAIIAEGGGHSQAKTKVTGTKNLAIPFYTASNPKRRIVPEFHTHLQMDGVAKKPSFKSQKGKMAVGEGARRDVTGPEANKLLVALGYK